MLLSPKGGLYRKIVLAEEHTIGEETMLDLFRVVSVEKSDGYGDDSGFHKTR